jgi:hypothetical protein
MTAGSLDVSSTAWSFENVKEIHNRRFQLQERALEIFLLNGKTYLVAFQSSKVSPVTILKHDVKHNVEEWCILAFKIMCEMLL